MRQNLIFTVLVPVSLMLTFGAHTVAANLEAQARPQVGKHKTLELVFTASSAPACWRL